MNEKFIKRYYQDLALTELNNNIIGILILPTGTGKTVAVQNLLNNLQPMPYDGGMGVLPLFMNFSAQTNSMVTQTSI